MYLILAIKIHEDGNSIESKKTRYLDDYRRRCSSGMKFFLMVGEINLFYSSQKRKMKNENRNYTQDSSYRHGCHQCDFISEQQLCWSSLITFRTRHQNHNKSGFKYFHFTAKKKKQTKHLAEITATVLLERDTTQARLCDIVLYLYRKWP